jgi:hypothetical protein
MGCVILVDASKLAELESVLIMNLVPEIVLDNPHAHAHILHLKYLCISKTSKNEEDKIAQ